MGPRQNFSGMVVVITGAAAGVGRAVAMRFAREGAKLGLISRDRTALEALADEVRLSGGQAALAAIDVSDSKPCSAPPTDLRANSVQSICGSTTRW